MSSLASGAVALCLALAVAYKRLKKQEKRRWAAEDGARRALTLVS